MAAARLRRRRRRRRAGRRRHRLGPGARGLHAWSVLDEGDRAVRASRGNFALVWVQSKGWGCAPYAGWTIRSSERLGWLRRTLKAETGLDVCFQRPGGFHLALSEKELEARANMLKRSLHNQPGIVDYRTEILDHAQVLQRDAAGHRAARWSAASYCPLDGHVQFAAPLPRAAHRGIQMRGVTYLPSHRVESIDQRRAASSGWPRRRRGARQPRRAGRRQRQHAARPDGRDWRAPMRPERGQIVVTERLRPFLHYPVVTVRQTDEGTVMIGDSKEESGSIRRALTLGVSATEAERAVRQFPLLGQRQRRAHLERHSG